MMMTMNDDDEYILETLKYTYPIGEISGDGPR